MIRYLNLPQIKAYLNASNSPQRDWVECSSIVMTTLRSDRSPPSINLLPSLLEKVQITLFNGDKDLICNYLGLEYMVGNLTWNNHTGFTDPETFDWYVNGNISGEYKIQDNLTLIKVFGASHMVPVDVPEAALDLIFGELNLDRIGYMNLTSKPKVLKTDAPFVITDIGYQSLFIGLIITCGMVLLGYLLLTCYKRRRKFNRDEEIQWHELANIDDDEDLFSSPGDLFD